jgi:tetratricopeptide (TPR) repeat protein
VLDHPSPETLKRWLEGRLPEEEALRVARHLDAGCRACEAASEPLLEALLREELGGAPPEEEEAAGAYDAATDRALSALGPKLAAVWSERETAERAYAVLVAEGEKGVERIASEGASGPALCTALLRRSHELRHRDPGQMLRLCWLATRAAAGLAARQWGDHRVADFRSRTLAELANAFRLGGNLARADEVMRTAVAFFAQGSQDPYLGARLMTLQATLLASQRHFDDALALLGRAAAVYGELGEEAEQARLLVKKGIYHGYAARPGEAIQALEEAVARIDPAADPELALEAAHSLAWFYMDAGRWRQSRALLWSHRVLYERHGQGVLAAKRRWLQGRIDAFRGELGTAEQQLTAALSGLAEAGLGYAAAIACLDLASVWLRLGKPRSAALLAEGAADSFLALGIGRESFAAIVVLREALVQENLSETLIHEVTGTLRRFVHDPAARVHQD